MGNQIPDLVVTPGDNGFVRDNHVINPIGKYDDLTVLTLILAVMPKLSKKMVCFCLWKSVDPEKFAFDLSWSSFVANPSDDLNVLLQQFTCSASDVFENTLRSVAGYTRLHQVTPGTPATYYRF